MSFMTPHERAERLREALGPEIVLVEGDETGPSWRLTEKGVARIAAVIRDAENDALERAAHVCEAVRLGARTRYSVLLGPDYLVTRSLLSRELAAAIRALKHGGEG